MLDCLHKGHNYLIFEKILEIALYLYDFMVLINKVIIFIIKVGYLKKVL